MTKIKLSSDRSAYFRFSNEYNDYYTKNIHFTSEELDLNVAFMIPKHCEEITRTAYETFKRRMRLK